MRTNPFLLLGLAALFSSCTLFRPAGRDDGRMEVTFVQVNDVYEIAPLAGGKEGGMARVATLRRQQQARNPNTFLVMAGDFVSPSVYNSLQFEGKRIRGRQMIEAMNAAGTDLAVFGNHEFDINEGELQQRLDESTFQWVASNTFHKKGTAVKPFARTKNPTDTFPATHVLQVRDADGTVARIGFIGLTQPFNKADYVHYTDALTTARTLYDQLKDSVDAVVAITHQSMEEDIRLAEALPGLALILGGHEHDQRFERVGRVPISKAHANARSAYVVNLRLNTKRGKVKIDPELVYLNESVPLDSAAQLVVDKWTRIADDNYASLGFNAREVVLAEGAPLEGRETEVRSRPTTLTQMIVSAMSAAAPEADVVLFNGGSIRVDDILYPPVTQYDIIRSLPFGGGIAEADLKGSILVRTLEQGRRNTGNGGFLHYNEAVRYDAATNSWQYKGAPIDPARTYRVAMAEFLLTGKEANMDFLQPTNPEVVKVYPAAPGSLRTDVRLAITNYLKNQQKR